MVLVCSHLLPALGVILISHLETRGGEKKAPQRHHPAWLPMRWRSQCGIGLCSHATCVNIFIDVIFRSCSLDTGDGSVTSSHPPDGGRSWQVKWGCRRNRLGSEGSVHTNAQCLCQEVFSQGHSAWLCWPLTWLKFDVGELTSNKVLHRVSPVNLY